jgi:hypothetical protein
MLLEGEVSPLRRDKHTLRVVRRGGAPLCGSNIVLIFANFHNGGSHSPRNAHFWQRASFVIIRGFSTHLVLQDIKPLKLSKHHSHIGQIIVLPSLTASEKYGFSKKVTSKSQEKKPIRYLSDIL